MSDFAYINTFIHMHCLCTAMNVDRRNFFHSQELSNGMFLNRRSSLLSISTGTELELWIAVGSRLLLVQERYHVTAWDQFYLVFVTLIKYMTEEAKPLSPSSYILCFLQIF